MNVRITPRGAPSRTDLYGGIREVYSDGRTLFLWQVDFCVRVPLATVATVALDDLPGDVLRRLIDESTV